MWKLRHFMLVKLSSLWFVSIPWVLDILRLLSSFVDSFEFFFFLKKKRRNSPMILSLDLSITRVVISHMIRSLTRLEYHVNFKLWSSYVYELQTCFPLVLILEGFGVICLWSLFLQHCQRKVLLFFIASLKNICVYIIWKHFLTILGETFLPLVEGISFFLAIWGNSFFGCHLGV